MGMAREIQGSQATLFYQAELKGESLTGTFVVKSYEDPYKGTRSGMRRGWMRCFSSSRSSFSLPSLPHLRFASEGLRSGRLGAPKATGRVEVLRDHPMAQRVCGVDPVKDHGR